MSDTVYFMRGLIIIGLILNVLGVSLFLFYPITGILPMLCFSVMVLLGLLLVFLGCLMLMFAYLDERHVHHYTTVEIDLSDQWDDEEEGESDA